MIQFDWSEVKRVSKNNRDVILVMSAITWPTSIPTKRQLRNNKFLLRNFAVGSCFLLEPEKLLSRKYELPIRTIVEYVALASRRSLADYILTGNKALDVRLAPYIPTNNQLLTITNSKVLFKYE